MTRSHRLAALTLFVAVLAPAIAPSARAAAPRPVVADSAWTRCGAPVSVGPGERTNAIALSDDGGGLFAVWQRVNPVSAHTDLWAQHLDSSGAQVAGWGPSGLALCTAVGDQTDPVAIPDGAGGFIVAWADNRADSSGLGNPDIFALRVDASGSVVAGWTAGGTPLTVSSRAQAHPAIATDGASGAFVAWEQPAANPADVEIVLQHVLAGGVIAPGWPDSGMAIAGGSGQRGSPTVVSDGAGGALVAWYDTRGGNSAIFAQRVAADGSAQWIANGLQACGSARSQVTPRAVADGAGGMLIAVQEWMIGDFNSVDVVTQRIDDTGAPVAGWPGSGVGACSASGAQVNHRIASDGAGGAYVSWDDFRSGASRSFVQHVQPDGTIAPGWNANGNAAGSDPVEQSETDLIADGVGGALVAWTEASDAVVAQRLAPGGSPSFGWAASGTTLCADHAQFTPALASDLQRGALVVFSDDRDGPTPELFASHVTQDALVPALLALSNLSETPHAVSLSWSGAPAGAPAELWRARDSEAWALIAQPLADGTGSIRYQDRDVSPGERLRYRLELVGSAAPTIETQVRVPALEPFAITRVEPNPSPGRFTLAIASPVAAPLRVELLDVAGRRVAASAIEAAVGENAMPFGDGRPLSPGVYTVRAVMGGAIAATRRVCIVR
ncbi:MAG TPA: T9SS type A sorting domain-containing protein [Candidatus Sulfotelmatobacter sp.]|nr:T9SS type A sorting domain-containing protein [Candidatus Sulfotelmatobacter sp.]